MIGRSLEDRLTDCVAIVFPELSRDEIPRAGGASLANWDSLAMVTLVSLVEEEFDVHFSIDEYQLAASYALLLDHLKSTNRDV